MGVGGTVRNLSHEGLLIDSRLDLLDVCQIFPEAMEDDSTFELEVVLTDSRERRLLIKGAVIWYRLCEPEGSVHHFLAGLHLTDSESRAIARNLFESVTGMK